MFAVGDVKLVANIIGDVLTSLAKPLGDLQYLFCYLRHADVADATRCGTFLLAVPAASAAQPDG